MGERFPRRRWTFYVQSAGLVAFTLFALAVNAWFMWRLVELRALGDMWPPTLVFGTVVGPVFLLFAGVMWTVFIKVTLVVPPPELPQEEPHAAENALFAPMLAPQSRGFRTMLLVLGAVTLWSLYAWVWQLRQGLAVTGMNAPVFWGLYITNFVFFIGISHAGTLISAILRIANAEWRRPITRSAEVITVLVLIFGGANIIFDVGRPDRVLNVFYYGRLQSPLLWDVCSITTYLTASAIYLYLPLIPDLALLRDRTRGWRHVLYELLAAGWIGTAGQKRVLERCISVMAVLVIPIAVSVHTVVSYVFSMTVQPMWHSAIFGPYFVVGAIFSGIAALIVAMALLRWGYRLQAHMRDVHFHYLGILLLVMSCLWFYFTFCEYLTTWYGAEPDHLAVFDSKLLGRYRFEFWAMVVFCFVIPFGVLVSPLRKTVRGTVIASVPVLIGMWLERYLIVVPTLVRPRMPVPTGNYAPSWVEASLFAGAVAAFILLYAVFTRLFPIVSIWETREGAAHAASEVSERIATYFAANDES